MALNAFTRGRLTPLGIAAIYLAFGLLALVVSDLVLPMFLADPFLGYVQGVKGGVEILLTAGLIYLLVGWGFRDLRLRERAIDAAPVGVTITDPDQPDNPIVFANEQFSELTGYDESEVVGRNCRFLQGAETDPETVADLGAAIADERPISVDVINYRANGSKFWNKLDVAPVRADDGTVTNFVGFQADITERKIREERLRVLNRVLRHNFRNKLTVIAGQVQLLRDHLEDPPGYVETIERTVDDLESLTETVRMNEAVLQAAMEADAVLALDEQLVVVVDAFEERYPSATISLSLPAETPRIRSAGLVRAVEEAIENAIKHNDLDEPTVEICVDVDDDGWLAIAVADDGPGMPPEEIEVLTEGEGPLKHANRLGLWSIYWIVNLAGGTMTIETADLGGTCVTINVPGADA